MYIAKVMIGANIVQQEVLLIRGHLQENQWTSKLINMSNDIRDMEALPGQSSNFEDIQPTGLGWIHLQWVIQIQNTDTSGGDSEPDELDSVLQDTKDYLHRSRNQRRILLLKITSTSLHNTRCGKVSFWILTKKQRNRLQAIPTDLVSTYITNRVLGRMCYGGT